MDAWILVAILVWFGIGIVVAVYIHLDLRGRNRTGFGWVAAGLLLNLIGLLAYHLGVRASRSHAYQYPPPPSYEGPQYGFGERRVEVQPVEDEGAKVEVIEGIPRCPHCGAAISSHDWDCPACGARLRY